MKLLCVIEKQEWSLKVDSLSKKQKSRLEKIGEAEKVARKKRSIFKVNRENITGNTYDFLLQIITEQKDNIEIEY